ncbi:MAG: LLM class F420-dependent oxidoreductase, partial [Candidatus Tectomicrobia bacterium]
MQLGVIFPQTEIGADPIGVRDFVQAAEELGYDHLIAFDHVLGADVAHYPGWQGPYTHQDLFHEPLVLFGYLAALTQRLELVTAVIILGQRSTALVAKQAAEVDVLSAGRLRLGVGIGWNAMEYEALNEDFHNRGKRSEEQFAVLRALWTQEVVDFHGRWHTIKHAGIKPLPVQRPIPLWLGGRVEAVVERVGRLADGWFPQFAPDDAGRQTLARMHEYARAAGRDPATIGIEGRINLPSTTPEIRVKEAEAWRELGATHLSVNTMRAGLRTP